MTARRLSPAQYELIGGALEHEAWQRRTWPDQVPAPARIATIPQTMRALERRGYLDPDEYGLVTAAGREAYEETRAALATGGGG